MKKYLLLTICLLCFAHCAIQAQEQTRGINYQAVARDASGQVLANYPLSIQVNFTEGPKSSANYFSEVHEVLTDDQGYFQILIGDGMGATTQLQDVPWAQKAIWLNTILSSKQDLDIRIENQSKLLSVPYTMFAASAKELLPSDEVELRNQSIYWLTSGNNDTRPPVHFLGNRDARDLVVKTDSTIRAIFTAAGQLEFYSGVTGNDQNPDAYPITVRGSTQGIWIKINGSRSGDNNFVAFADNDGFQGAIEGQTAGELALDPFFILTNAFYILEGVSLGVSLATHIGEVATNVAAGSAAIASIFCSFAAPGFYAAAVAEGLNAAAVGVEIAALLTNSISWNAIQFRDIGVTYSSGGADYAEYLPRLATERDLSSGEIVGVKNGMISLNTEDAHHYKVISTAPIILGNAPSPEVGDYYEKVAFLGQVVVKVSGAVRKGDYIIPSGNHDGVGVAVHPDNLAIEDFHKIVGVAWEDASNNALNYIHVGVGLNSNDLAPKVEQISDKIDNIINYLEGSGTLHPEKTLAQQYPIQNDHLQLAFSNQEFDQLVDANADAIVSNYQKMGADLTANGLDIPNTPLLQEFLADPITELKKMRRNPDLKSYWAQLDQLIIQQGKNN